ncbi:MAG: dTDP-glucose 4,6-dehydratase [Ignavibacteriaceae bacterium]|nr:dTDP-glucose 4,6-dehydratase [Ignavibacteriaceae bacterium]
MNILVTGGAGFIGSNFIRYWIKNNQDDTIVNFDKLTYAGNLENLEDVSKDTRYKFIKGDITVFDQINSAIKNNSIDLVVHFAAESHVDRSIIGPADFINTNINGTFNILEVVRQNPGIRLHHISTDEVFGSLKTLEPKFNENTKYSPRSPYSASKASSDHLVRAYIDTYNIKATISNCSNNYGAYCYPEKLIPLTITRALMDQRIPVYGSGKQVRDWIHVEDHCRGIELILKEGKLGETYLLGGNGERENIWIVMEILRLLNKPKELIQFVGDRKGHDFRYAIDYSRAKNELGFEPLKPIEERLKETVEWYASNKQWWQPLKKSADVMADRYLQK